MATMGIMPLNKLMTLRKRLVMIFGDEDGCVLVLRMLSPLDVPIFDRADDVALVGCA